MRSKLRRAWTRITSDIIPDMLSQIRLGRYQYKLWQPTGRARAPEKDQSVVVPFDYAIQRSDRGAIAVVCHLFHTEGSDRILRLLCEAGLKAVLYLSTDTEAKAQILRRLFSAWTGGRVEVRVVENRGRDIASKLIAFADIYDRHDLILFLHSKKSPHFPFGDAWRDHLVRCLVGSPAIVASIMEIFERCPQIGMIVPQHFQELRKRNLIAWGGNFRQARRLAWRMDIDLSPTGYLDMPSGSMFWARPKALRPLLGLGFGFKDFPPEPCQVDGTLAHCIERLFLFSCERAGYGWLKVTDRSSEDPAAVTIHGPSDIASFVARHDFHLLGPDGGHA